MQILDEESIFHQAIEIENESARNRFLESSCNGDHDLRGRLGDLVKMHFSKGRILDETRDCHAMAMRMVDVPKVGSVIGDYKLQQEIGEGGMGVVFMAQQTKPVKRQVALKVIKIGMDTRRVVARFESERQAMAMMDHPCITRIYDAGATESGRPYFVMELVRGTSITKYCDEHRLSVRERLQIFVRVCNALEHAHQKGIIHRDIKPNNIMVTNHDGQPIPKIIDFGIAKAINDPLTDMTLFTNYGEMVGTPMYMSPEQSELSELDVDTRTDIYSLGVLLYELLTGTTPFHELKKKSFHDICKAIQSNEPQLASTRINQLGDTVKQISLNRDTDVRSLQRFIQGELDWILVKCLARDRRERYQSAGELAREIERYLNGEVVEAAAPTWRYRAKKFVTKHKAAVAMAASIAALLLATTLFSSYMALKANKATELANSRLKVVEEQREKLVELERKQRNRVAIHEAAATVSANNVKRFLANGFFVDAEKAGPSVRPAIQVRPIGSYWPSAPDGSNTTSVISTTVNRTGTTKREPQARMSFKGPAHVGNDRVDGLPAEKMWMFNDDQENENIEVIVMAGEDECQESLLKSILQNQRKAFGDRDIIVAQTLQQLGELTSGKQNWEQSEKYFREALEILKDTAHDNKQLGNIRLKLVNALEKQGDLKQVFGELQEIKQNFESSQLHDDVNDLLKKFKSELGGKKADSQSDNQ